MANPTSNFGWVMPTSTDLVTDLPADFAVFGQAVDTSMADLKGGTSGQVLSKNSNTDMDFVWVTSDDANAIQNTIVDAKGDLISATAADTPARLAVGTNGQVLTADSTASTGIKWATPSSGALTLISATTMSNVSSQAVNPFSTTYDNYLVLITLTSSTGNNATTRWQFRNGSTNRTTAYYAGSQMIGYQGTKADYYQNNGTFIDMVGNVGGSQGGLIVVNVANVNGSGVPSITGTSVQGLYQYYFGGIRDAYETNDGFIVNSSNVMTGSIRVYGVQKS